MGFFVDDGTVVPDQPQDQKGWISWSLQALEDRPVGSFKIESGRPIIGTLPSMLQIHSSNGIAGG